MRVLLSAIAAIALIAAGALVMDWYRMAMPGGKVAIDLRNLSVCHQHACVSTSISPMPGMFPTLATLTMWASLALIAVVAFQATTRVLTGAANEAFSKLGYALALVALSLAVATAYVFGPEDQGDMTDVIAQVNMVLPRTWAPATLLVGLITGLAALYMAIAPESGDTAAYKPVTIDPAQRTKPPSAPLPIATARVRRPSEVPLAAGSIADTAPPAAEVPSESGPVVTRARSGPLPTMPPHFRKRLSYTALTAELTAGGIDARREDGSSRLVLWRDVVGVVARRLPTDFDGTTFIDIVSTAGSTLRIVPWTRVTGELTVAEGDARPRSVVERVLACCPEAHVDPATRAFLEDGEAAQLPDLATLSAHDERLA
jgi:hypothetical protein